MFTNHRSARRIVDGQLVLHAAPVRDGGTTEVTFDGVHYALPNRRFNEAIAEQTANRIAAGYQAPRMIQLSPVYDLVELP